MSRVITLVTVGELREKRVLRCLFCQPTPTPPQMPADSTPEVSQVSLLVLHGFYTNQDVQNDDFHDIKWHSGSLAHTVGELCSQR